MGSRQVADNRCLGNTATNKDFLLVRQEGKRPVQFIELYETTCQNIGLHIENIYVDMELPREATIKKFFIVQQDDIPVIGASMCFSFD